jgi:hypothetical protein
MRRRGTASTPLMALNIRETAREFQRGLLTIPSRYYYSLINYIAYNSRIQTTREGASRKTGRKCIVHFVDQSILIQIFPVAVPSVHHKWEGTIYIIIHKHNHETFGAHQVKEEIHDACTG